MRLFVAALLLAVLTTPAHAAADEPNEIHDTLLLFDLEFTDSSGESVDPDHAGRLARMTGVLRDGLVRSGRYEVIGIHDSAVAPEAPAAVYSCNGCEIDLGRKANVTIVATGFIHKISSLILNLQIILRAVDSGEVVAMGIADIRGDTELAWRRGVEWLLLHRLVAERP